MARLLNRPACASKKDACPRQYVAVALVAGGLAGSPFLSARAQGVPPAEVQTPIPQQTPIASGGPGLWDRANLLGDPFGTAAWTDAHGISAGLTLASEVLRTTSGGFELSTHVQNEAVLTFGLDTDRAFGWHGGRFYASGLLISGSGVSIDGVGSLTTISSIEAEHSIRLFDLWYEQAFLGGRASIRIGQMGGDEEFLLTGGSEVFLNGDFGWPTLASIDLPNGGPTYPLATPGIRLKLEATSGLTALAAVFNGNPSPDGFGDPQQTNRLGLNFRLDGGAFTIAELQWHHEFGTPALNLPGTFKLGAWWNTNTFLDRHLDANGLSLADINSTGFPALRRNDWSVYATADQVLWRPSGADDQGLSAFLRWMGAPDDRNQVSVEIDGGLTFRGMFPSRPNDTLGLGFGWFKISQAARALDRDLAALGVPRPIRSAEGLIEATYQAEITKWWQLQPDLQYIIRPGGGVPGGQGGRSLNTPLPNSLIVAIRSTITF